MIALNKTRLIAFVALLSTLAGALVFRTPAIVFLAAMLLGAPLLAALMGKWMSHGLRVSRQMPGVGTVGDVISARVTVRNGGWIPALLVHAQGRGEKTKELPAPFEAQNESELVVPILMPGAEFEGEIAWKLKRRGLYAWPGARAGALDPVGLNLSLPARSAPSELLVLPRPLILRRLETGGNTRGAQPLPSRATATDAAEFSGVRPYQPGESGRRIHWRATARTGELHVIEWEEESASDQTILLDTNAATITGAAGDDTLEATIVAAASVAAFLVENGQRARLFWWADGAQGLRLMRFEARHRAGLAAILTALAKIAPCRDPDATLSALARRVAGETREDNAILLGSDASQWQGALETWKNCGRARGLAFECATFDTSADSTHFTLRTAGMGAVTATMRRAATSKTVGARVALPSQVRLVTRNQSLAAALEEGF